MRTRLLLVLALCALTGGGNGACLEVCGWGGPSSAAAAAPAGAAPCHSAPAPASGDGHDGCLHCASLVAFSSTAAVLADLSAPAALRLVPSSDAAALLRPVRLIARRTTGPPAPDLRLLQSSFLL